jgi:hypothetical protein
MLQTSVTDSERQLADRRPVWEALSELFLDTELSPAVRAGIVRTLAQSPYSLPELRAILREEVHPVCVANLLSVAGVWSRFDPDWLQRTILAREHAWIRWPWWLTPLRGHTRTTAESLFAQVDALRRERSLVNPSQ